MNPLDGGRLTEFTQRLRDHLPDDAKAQNLLNYLDEEAAKLEREHEEAQQAIKEYAEAYDKLTSPANRIAVILRLIDTDKVALALGDTEYVALIDPKLKERDELKPGVRVAVNDAYAVVGIQPPQPGGALIKVAEVTEDGRIKVGGDSPGMGSRLVQLAHSLEGAKIEAGDEIRLDPSGRLAVEHFPRSETNEYFVEEIPEVPWSAIGGQEEAIKTIRDTIEQPLLHPEIYTKFDKKPVKGILLFGPPGCGKTLIGKATAYNLAKSYSERVGHSVKEYFLHISGPKILNMWLGETERMVRQIFEVARKKAKEGRLVVVFIDEAESILRTRSAGRWLNISNTVVPQFCAEMDGLMGLENVVVILTSNRPDYIDPAILRPERIDRKVKIRRPQLESAKTILGIYLHERLPVDPELLTANDGVAECARRELIEAAAAHLWREAKETEFLMVHYRNGNAETLHYRDLVSGALLKSVVDRAKGFAIERAIDSGAEEGLSVKDLRDAIDAEYAENEIFPKSDVMEDWLKLIDVEPESVASVKPVGPNKGLDYVRKNVI